MPHAIASSATPVVDLWCMNTDIADAQVRRHADVLSREECARAERYRSDSDRRRFIVRRGMLRELLARELDCAAHDISITENEFGKPVIAGSDVRFNVSHSRGMAIVALATAIDIGCDIEWSDTAVSNARAASLFLSPSEYRFLCARSGEERTAAFFAFWTRKEAYLKARGTGLTVAADTVVLAGGDEARFVALPDDDPKAWSLTDLPLPNGYCGALALRGPAPRIRLRS